MNPNRSTWESTPSRGVTDYPNYASKSLIHFDIDRTAAVSVLAARSTTNRPIAREARYQETVRLCCCDSYVGISYQLRPLAPSDCR